MKKVNILGVYFEITSKCNAFCKYCYNDSSSQKIKNISFEKIEEIFYNLKKSNIKEVTISGGEPLLHSDFLKILECANKYDFNIILFTNGMLLNDFIIRKIIECNAKVQITLNGSNAKIHEKINNNKGSFKKIINALEIFDLYEYLDNVYFKTILQSDNFCDTENIILLAKKNNIKTVSFTFLTYSGREKFKINGSEYGDRIIYSERMKQLTKKYPDIKIDYSSVVSICKFCKDIDILKVYPKVDSSGNVFLCTLFENELSIGSCYEDKIMNILSVDKINRFCNNLKVSYNNFEKCKSCIYRERCKGGCCGIAHIKYNRLFDDGFCEIRIANFLEELKAKRVIMENQKYV